MRYEKQFIVGKTYLTAEGKKVTIIAECDEYGPAYRHVQGGNGETRIDEMICAPGVYEITEGSQLGWRYDREGDVGRCTGSSRGPRDLVPGTELPN